MGIWILWSHSSNKGITLKDPFSKLRDKVTSLQKKELGRDYLIESLGVVVTTTLVGRELGSYMRFPIQGALLGAGLGMVIITGVSVGQVGSKLGLKS
jgi:hypothetical protein